MNFGDADFFTWMGFIAKALVVLIGLRLLMVILGFHIDVPLLDPLIDMIRRGLISLGISLPNM